MTTTTTFRAITTVSDAAACNSFSGACVVYGGSASASTVYVPASSQGHAGVGNGDGYIGMNRNDGGEGLRIAARRSWMLLVAATGFVLMVTMLSL